MRHPAQHLLVVASSRVPWLVPAIGIALFVHKHFISYQSQDPTAAKAKANSRSRPPKLRRALKKVKAGTDVAIVDVNSAAVAEQDQLAAAGLSSDKLMEWFTEDEVEALQQAQANPAALLSLLSGSRFMVNQQFDQSSDEGSEWYPDTHDQPWLHDSDYDSNGSYIDGQANSQSNSHEDGFKIRPLSELSKALSNSSYDDSAVQSPSGPSAQLEQQQQWQVAQQLLQQLADPTQQQTAAQDAVVGSQSSAADYFDPSHYYGISPAANRRSRASLDIMQGHYLPRTGALWAASYPPHLEDMSDLDPLQHDADEQADATQAQFQTSERQLGTSAAGPAGTSHTQQPQQGHYMQPQQQRPSKLLAEYEPPMPNFEPYFDFDLDYEPEFDFDYAPDYVPQFEDELGFDFDPLDAAFVAAPVQA